MSKKTYVIGMGIHSSIGTNLDEVADNLRHGRSGIGVSQERKTAGYRSALTSAVPEVDVSSLDCGNFPIPPRILKGLSNLNQMAVAAVKQALEQSGITDLTRVGLIVSNDSTAEETHKMNEKMANYRDTRFLRANTVLHTMNSTVSMHLAELFRFGGLSLTISAACAGGGHAVGLAHTLIQSGVLHACVVVGAQENDTYAYTAFDAMGVFSTREDEPQQASKPFDVDRSGLVPSGGAAALVLCSDVYADIIGARNLQGYICSYGFSTNRMMVTPDANAEYKAMWNAMDEINTSDFHFREGELAFIAAHATGTHDGDEQERQAINEICHSFTPNDDVVPVVCAKALTGHECWMSGVSQVVYSLLQFQHHVTASYPTLSKGNLILGPHAWVFRDGVNITKEKKYALINSFGFGGTNACLVIERA